MKALLHMNSWLQNLGPNVSLNLQIPLAYPFPSTFPRPSCFLWDTQDFTRLPESDSTWRQPSGQAVYQVLPALLVGVPMRSMRPSSRGKQRPGLPIAFRVSLCLPEKATMNRMIELHGQILQRGDGQGHLSTSSLLPSSQVWVGCEHSSCENARVQGILSQDSHNHKSSLFPTLQRNQIRAKVIALGNEPEWKKLRLIPVWVCKHQATAVPLSATRARISQVPRRNKGKQWLIPSHPVLY